MLSGNVGLFSTTTNKSVTSSGTNDGTTTPVSLRKSNYTTRSIHINVQQRSETSVRTSNLHLNSTPLSTAVSNS